MLVTTLLLAEVARRRWGWGMPTTFGVIGTFLVVDLAFFSANSVKIIEGGWFPLVVGAVVFTLMSTWRRGRQLLIERTSEDNPPLARFIAKLDPSGMPRVRGTEEVGRGIGE
jgi:KUP system potassium uptake protein